MTKSGRATAAVLAVAAMALGACGGGGETPPPETVTQVVTPDGAPAGAAEPESAAAQPSAAPARQGDAPAGEDPVFAAIEAVLAAHPAGAVVVDVDRDDGDTYDVDLVVAGEVLELEVGPDGAVREDEREGDDDDVREAQAATVTATDAIRQALDRHPGGVLDEIELDEDDGVLTWEIELDDADRNDLAELEIPAA